MPSFCPAPLRPATQDEQNSGYRLWVSGGGIGGVPGTGGLDQRDSRGRSVPTCTSTAPPVVERGEASPAFDLPSKCPLLETIRRLGHLGCQ